MTTNEEAHYGSCLSVLLWDRRAQEPHRSLSERRRQAGAAGVRHNDWRDQGVGQLADGVRLRDGGHGEHGAILETPVQPVRIAGPGHHDRQRRPHEGGAGAQDRFKRRGVDRGASPARPFAGQLRPQPGTAGTAGTDPLP